MSCVLHGATSCLATLRLIYKTLYAYWTFSKYYFVNIVYAAFLQVSRISIVRLFYFFQAKSCERRLKIRSCMLAKNKNFVQSHRFVDLVVCFQSDFWFSKNTCTWTWWWNFGKRLDDMQGDETFAKERHFHFPLSIQIKRLCVCMSRWPPAIGKKHV